MITILFWVFLIGLICFSEFGCDTISKDCQAERDRKRKNTIISMIGMTICNMGLTALSIVCQM